MKNSSFLIKTAGSMALLAAHFIGIAQDNTYVAPTGNMVTFTGANVAIFGNLINDARGTASTAATANTGVNHNGGGTVYLYRRTAHGTGNSRIYDGTNNALYGTGTDNYNAGGKAVRFYNLITDNNVGSATASGTAVNTTSGSGHIQLEQEVCVSNQLTFTNGMIWTPRGSWKHAYLHFDAAGATYTGAGASNTAFTSPATNMQVDGYVAKTGASNFTFPIGDGVYTRFAGLSAPASGIYKAAYFHQNANSLTTGSGISGSSTQGSTATLWGGITKVNTTEFWDIDGTGMSDFTLTAFNSGGYSNWNADFSGVPSAMPDKIVIAGLDDWQNLDIAPIPATYGDDGAFTTAVATNPDSGAPVVVPSTGNPYVAYTWAIAPLSVPLPVRSLSLNVASQKCAVELKWKVEEETLVENYDVYSSTDGAHFTKVKSIPSNGTGVYSMLCEQKERMGYYRIVAVEKGGTEYSSNTRLAITSCGTDVTIAPNPTTGVFTIYNLNGGEQIRILNSVGQVVKDTKATSNTSNINMSDVAAGVYVVQIHRNNEQVANIPVLKN